MVNFEEMLANAETDDEIKKLKVWMFQEQVRIQAQKEELIELSRELELERKLIERDRNALDRKIKAENKRFQDSEIFIAKKLKIIEEAYYQLSLDKKALECERLNLDYEMAKFRRQRAAGARKQPHVDVVSSYEGAVFFRGIDNELALRKRYKELLKIFHPDNKCGDTKTLMRVQAEYEKIKKEYYEV